MTPLKTTDIDRERRREHQAAVNQTTIRVHRGVLTMSSIPDRENNWLYHSDASGMPEIVRDWREAYGYEEERLKFRPTSYDVQDVMTVYDALAWLRRTSMTGERDIKIIGARAFETPWWKIADRLRLRRSEKSVRRHHAAAIEALHGRLSDPPAR